MGMTINRAMDYAKFACGIPLTIVMMPLDLSQSLNQIIEYAVWDDPKSGESIQILPIPIEVPSRGLTDTIWFKENMICLISNAIKYSGQPIDITIQISIVEVEGKELAEFSVQDSGKRVSDTKLLRMFDPPIQGRRGSIGGMGLGLICLAERVTALRGGFGACRRSDDKSGNIIWFRIPLEETDLEPATPFSPWKRGQTPVVTRNKKIAKCLAASPRAKTRGCHDELAMSGLTILLVDDAVTILKMASFILTKAGAKVTQAKNGREAVELSNTIDFDIVITDIQMPVLDGFEATREMRALEQTSGARVKIIIGITAISDGNNNLVASEAGQC
jgi:CheY-like chemotaxis protein